MMRDSGQPQCFDAYSAGCADTHATDRSATPIGKTLTQPMLLRRREDQPIFCGDRARDQLRLHVESVGAKSRDARDVDGGLEIEPSTQATRVAGFFVVTAGQESRACT